MTTVKFDIIINNIIDNLYNFITYKKILDFDKIKDLITFHNKIIQYIKLFLDDLQTDENIISLNKESYYNNILHIIKKYSMIYLILGLGYYYQGNEESYISYIKFKSFKYRIYN